MSSRNLSSLEPNSTHLSLKVKILDYLLVIENQDLLACEIAIGDSTATGIWSLLIDSKELDSVEENEMDEDEPKTQKDDDRDDSDEVEKDHEDGRDVPTKEQPKWKINSKLPIKGSWYNLPLCEVRMVNGFMRILSLSAFLKIEEPINQSIAFPVNISTIEYTK